MAVALLGAAALAACSATPEVRAVAADVNGVSFEFPLKDEAEAGRQAALYCANLGRSVERQTLTPEGEGLARATYACR
ncbi:MAG TPA: hypothetical protein VLX85_08245 [Stellaceae bacterium]|nr:hypothetical protein [Stellaceae bacterium]